MNWANGISRKRDRRQKGGGRGDKREEKGAFWGGVLDFFCSLMEILQWLLPSNQLVSQVRHVPGWLFLLVTAGNCWRGVEPLSARTKPNWS